MLEVRGDALEWAIALSKAPAERMALRRRPLPGGIELVLQIAGGVSRDALTEAATRAAETEADLLDAARFYIREILFYQGADAYRVLGLARDADPEMIRTHYRLLQHWLHPDRHTSDWDAIFASRVNAAWNQLRTPARRADYDAQTPADDRNEHRGGLSWMTPARLSAMPEAYTPAGADQVHRDRWRRRAPVLALFGVCVVLAIVALRDVLREPPDHLQRLATVDSPVVDSRPSPSLKIPKQRTTLGVGKPGASPEPGRRHPVQVPEPASNAQVRTQVAAAVVSPAAKSAAIASVAKPAAAPVATAPVATPAAKVVASAAVITPGKRTVAVAAASKPAAMAAIDQVASRVPAHAADVMSPAARSPATPAISAIAVPQARVPVSASPFQVGQAQLTGQQIMAYIASRSGAVPPIWDNPGVQAQALQMRTALQEQGQVHGDEPHWRVGGDAAAMSTRLNAGDARQQLRVALVWREQRWLVTALALDKAP